MNKNWESWSNWALKDDASALLKEAYNRGELKSYKEFDFLEQTDQNSHWHPEGNVWVHTLFVIEAATDIAIRENLSDEQRIVLVLSGLCHDLGKPDTTKVEEGRIRSPGHAQIGARISEQFLREIDCPELCRLKIISLVKEHLVYSSFQTVTDRALKRLVKRLEPANFDELLLLVEADHSGRPPLPKKLPDVMLEIKARIEKLEID